MYSFFIIFGRILKIETIVNIKKLFPLFIFFVLYFSPSNAQDSLICRNGKKIFGKVLSVGKEKVVYMIPPDSSLITISTWKLDYIAYPGGTKFHFTEIAKTALPSATEFYLSGDFGMGVPSISYRDAIVGVHFGIRANYYFDHHIGIVAKAVTDFNGTGLDYVSSSYWGGFYIFQQYMAGLTYRTGGKPGFPFVDFVGLCGLCKANNPPTVEQGGGVVPLTLTHAGNGSGVGYYLGIDFTSSSAAHLVSFTFGAGFLYSVFSYPDYTSTVEKYNPYTAITRNSTLDGNTKMGLVLYQMYVGINFRVKKAGK
jgi:hypothetical protein